MCKIHATAHIPESWEILQGDVYSPLFYWTSSVGAICCTSDERVLFFKPFDNGDACVQTTVSVATRSGDSSVVRVPDSWLKGCGFKSLQQEQENFLLQGRLSVLTLISVSVHPHVTAVARKTSWSFCQKCRWQVTAKHAYTLRMWLYIVTWCMVIWCTLNMRRDGSCLMCHQPCERCKYTTSVDI